MKSHCEQQAVGAKSFQPSGTFVEFPIEDVETSIPERFEKMVRLFGDRLAVKMGERSLTYDELNRYANRIAHAILEKRGPGSEPIALYFKQGIDLIAAIFGVLKAGKFYVVLDPNLPLERLNKIIEDSQSGIILTSNRHLQNLEQLCNFSGLLLGLETICTDSGEANCNVAVSPDNIATVTYTSGTTGKPKGVVKTHRYIFYAILLQNRYLAPKPSDRLSLIHSISFGSGQVNFFQGFLNGASVCLFDVKAEGVFRLTSWLRSEEVTIFHSSPSLLRQLIEADDNQEYPYLRLINVSGEPLTSRDMELFRTHFRDTPKLGVLMGTTETHAIGYCTITPDFQYPSEGAPIGYPVPGKTILIIGDNGEGSCVWASW